MAIEFEATFLDIEKENMRERLRRAGASLVKPEQLMRRVNFSLPGHEGFENAWLRVRDEGDAITLSFKHIEGNRIEDQKETCLHIDDFYAGIELLESVGAQRKAYQETLRELWMLDGVEITIDTWPFLEPFVEVEGKSEQAVQEVSEKLGFDYRQALFCSVVELYHQKYQISHDRISNHTPLIIFNMENPFL